MKTAKKTDSPDLMGALGTKPRRGRPPKVVSSPTAEQIATDLEARGRAYLETARILRGKAKAK